MQPTNKFDAKPGQTITKAEAPKAGTLDEIAERSQTVLDAGRYQPADEQGLEGLARRYYMSGTLPDSYYPGKNEPQVPIPGQPGKFMAARWSEYAIEAGTSRAFIVMLFGAGMGILPSSAIWQIHVINGRPCPSADFMWARMIATGTLKRDDFSIEASRMSCKIVIGTKSRPVAERLIVEAKYDDYKHLHGKDNWKNHPEDMLVARAKSRIARRYAPDMFAGVYSADEMRTSQEDAAAGHYEVPAEFMPQDSPPIEAPPVAPAPVAETAQGAVPVVDVAQFQKDLNTLGLRLKDATGSVSDEERAELRAKVEATRAVSSIAYDALVKKWAANEFLGPYVVAS